MARKAAAAAPAATAPAGAAAPADAAATAGEARTETETPEVELVTVVVTGPREGRYRCGRLFTEVTSAPFAVTAEDYERLKADPKLMVMPAG